jgi:hypothetical protein
MRKCAKKRPSRIERKVDVKERSDKRKTRDKRIGIRKKENEMREDKEGREIRNAGTREHNRNGQLYRPFKKIVGLPN